MAKPSNDAAGVIIIPQTDFQQWVQTYYLKPAPGTFVTWGTVKLKGDALEVKYATSTTEQPPPPEDVTTYPT